MFLYEFRVAGSGIAQGPCSPLDNTGFACKKNFHQLIEAVLIAADIFYNEVALRL